MNLFIYNYNNYYNRKVKVKNTLAAYGEPIHSLIGCKDFSPNDGVNTQHIFGSAANNYNGSGDYLIYADEYDNIISRWFIIEVNFTRAGQWHMILRRDLFADYYNDIVNADTFIEKATLAYDDPLVFNSENMSVNQIKTNETLLKDASGCAWLVGYYNRDATAFNVTAPSNEETTADKIVLSTPISSWSYYKHVSKIDDNDISGYTPFNGAIQSCSYEIIMTGRYSAFSDVYRTDYKTGSTSTSSAGKKIDSGLTNLLTPSAMTGPISNAYQPFLTTLESQLYAYIDYNYTSAINNFLALNGKLIEDSNGRIYRVSLGDTNTVHESAKITSGSMFNTLSNVLSELSSIEYSGTPNSNAFLVGANVTQYTLVLTDVSQQSGISVTISEQRVVCEDAPWNIFAIPYGTITVKNAQGSEIVTTSKDIGLRIAMTLAADSANINDQTTGAFKLYDLQLLPYCPFAGLQSNGSIIVSNTDQYDEIRQDDVTIGIIFHIQYSKFTKTLYGYSQNYNNTSIGKKLHNECDKWRLTAPNYSNYFDFSVEKNNGVSSFNIDCEYKPFTPYIHINPEFKGLYGYDDNSPRGLVCGGDYSLSQVVDQWAEYQRQNKNFQLTFDRQIQNMEVQNNIARVQEKWQVAAGTVQGAASGALAGSVGGGYAAIAGGIVGGVSSLAGGLADIKYNEQLRNEAMDYTKDMFGYSLGNIQAAPSTISKVSALNNNNKIFPILEFYTCTDREKKAFLNKVAWNGMTVMAIGKINDYIGNSWSYNGVTSKGYIKGQLIRLETIDEDFHLINAIAGELNKGVYF